MLYFLGPAHTLYSYTCRRGFTRVDPPPTKNGATPGNLYCALVAVPRAAGPVMCRLSYLLANYTGVLTVGRGKESARARNLVEFD